MKCGTFVIFVDIPIKLPIIATAKIKTGFSINNKWKEVPKLNIFPPSQGRIISLRLPMIMEPVIPINKAGINFDLYL